jgi:hypothetical protein
MCIGRLFISKFWNLMEKLDGYVLFSRQDVAYNTDINKDNLILFIF